MRNKLFMTSILIALFTLGALADTKSDYDRSYDFSRLKTWDFKAICRVPNDPVAQNSLWDQRVRSGLEQHLAEVGFKRVPDGEPDFLVTYFMGVKERYNVRFLNYGFPGRWGRWGGWRGWGPGWWPGPVDVWMIPYTESTLVADVIDPHTNQLIWRGYDTRTIDIEKSEKTIHKSVEHLAKRFIHDVRESAEKKSKPEMGMQ